MRGPASSKKKSTDTLSWFEKNSSGGATRGLTARAVAVSPPKRRVEQTGRIPMCAVLRAPFAHAPQSEKRILHLGVAGLLATTMLVAAPAAHARITQISITSAPHTLAFGGF